MRAYGFEPDRISVREGEAAFIRAAAQRVLDGESLRATAAWLNEQGSRTSGGHEWQSITLRRVLMSPRVAGLVENADEHLVKASWPPIVDRVSWKRLVNLLNPELRRTNPGPPAGRVYLLTGGIARCGLCQAPLVARPNDNGTRGYVCASGPATHGCGRIRVSAVPLETLVAERVLARMMKANRGRITALIEVAAKEGKDARELIAAADGKLRSLGVAYAEGKIGEVEFHAAAGRIRARVKQARAEARLGAVASDVAQWDVEDVAEWWGQAPGEVKRKLIELLVESVEVGPAPVRGSRSLDPARVKVNWK